jgi:DNA-binding transcriptional regulator LsrR (DeoR family)
MAARSSEGASRKSAKRLRGPSNSRFDDVGLILEGARLYYQRGLSQEEISEVLGVSQSTVSRILARADAFVEYVILPPSVHKLEANLSAIMAPQGVRDVRVVPRGAGDNAQKNADNLGEASAEHLAELLANHKKSRVTICISCGDTLLAIVSHFLQYLRRSPDALDRIRAKTLVLYPTNLYWDTRLQFNIDDQVPSTSVYPSALVLFLAMGLEALRCKVIAHVPQPPLGFYAGSSEVSIDDFKSQIEKYDSLYIEKAQDADIFLIGIGWPQDEKYKRVVRDVAPAFLDRDDIAGEINYQPFTINGDFPHFSNLIAVPPERLIKAACSDSKSVIAVAGGEVKIFALRALLQRKQLPFNAFITDEALAEGLMAGQWRGQGNSFDQIKIARESL